MQEVFTRLWVNREIIQADNLSGYLYSAARNRVQDHYAHKEVKLKCNNRLKPDLDTVATGHLVGENQLLAIIEKEIAGSSPRMREVFEMSRKQHMTHKEIDEALGTSGETVIADYPLLKVLIFILEEDWP